jgi:hypothetical protein
MAQTTPFILGAEARCSDGVCGEVSRDLPPVDLDHPAANPA